MPAVNPIQSSLINATFPPTSLHRAILEKKPLSELVPLINPSSINKTINTLTPLHLSIMEEQPLLTEFLLSQGADPSIVNASGDNALHMCVLKQNQACLEKIVNSPAGRKCIDIKNRDSNTPLAIACDDGNVPAVTALIGAGANVNEKNGAHDSTALHWAARINCTDIVQALIDAGAKLESEDNAGDTPLQVACHYGKELAAEFLIKAGADTEVKSKLHKMTLIHLAAEANQAGIIRLLHRLKPTTDLETPIGPGFTALSVACSYGSKQAAEALLEAGAKVETKIGPLKMTALHVAAMNGQAQMIPLLLNAKANIEEITTAGVTPLGMAVSREKEEAAAALIKAGANVKNISTLENQTLLYFAADKNWASVIRLLRERYHSLDLEAKTLEVTPLARACLLGHTEAVQALLEVGAKVDTPCQLNKSHPIHCAAWGGHAKIISLLLDAEAKVEEKTGLLETPLFIACGEGKLEAADVLIKRGANVRSKNDQTEMTPLHGAAGAKENSAALIRLLHEKKVDIEAKTTEGATALCVACDVGNLEGARALLEVGANVNTETNVKITPLHLAASKDHSDIIRLLGPKANLEAKDSNKFTPLGLACAEGKLAAAEALIAGGAKVDASNGEYEYSALHLAVSSSRWDIIRLLHRVNANFDCTNPQGLTPLSLACGGKLTETVKLLLELGANPDTPNGKIGLTALHVAVVSNYPEGIPLLAAKANLEAIDSNGETALFLACCERKIEEALALIEAGAKIETKNGPNQLTALQMVPPQFASRIQEAANARAEWEAMNRPVDGKTIRDLLKTAKPPINPKEIENLRVIPETKRYLSAP